MAVAVIVGGCAAVAWVLGGEHWAALPYSLPQAVFSDIADRVEWREGPVMRRVVRLLQGATYVWWVVVNLFAWVIREEADDSFWGHLVYLCVTEAIAYAPMVLLVAILFLTGM